MLQYSTYSEIGDRSTQQDRFCIGRVGTFLAAAVFDGHGGSKAAEDCSISFLERLSTALEQRSGNLEDTLRDVIGGLVADLGKERSGTTVSAVLIDGQDEDHRKITIAVLGDSPAVVFDPQTTEPVVTPQHNVALCPEDVAFIRRRIGHGDWGRASISQGYLWEPYGQRGVNLTRTIGDTEFEGLLLRLPFIATHPFPPGALLLLGTDGIRCGTWPATDTADAMWTGCREAADLVRHGGGPSDLVHLAKRYAEKMSAPLDNLTAIVVQG